MSVDAAIGKRIIEEVTISESNRSESDSDYSQALQVLEGIRTDPSYEWMANYQIPEFASHYLTRQAIDAQFLTTRDYADIYLESTGERFLAAAEAQKELINRTLNQRHLNFPLKYLRTRAIADLNSNAVVRCWWERKSIAVPDGENVVSAQDNEFAGESVPTTMDVTFIDRFNMDIIDPENVFWDSSYAYSLQGKKWVTIRLEETISGMKRNAKLMGYDLDKIKEVEDFRPPAETEGADKTYAEDDSPFPDEPDRLYTLYERHGIFPAVIKSVDRDGYPTRIESGYDEHGDEIEDSIYIETTVTTVSIGGTYITLRFQPQKNRTDSGEAYKPLIRLMAYLDPRKDGGFSDASFIIETQEVMSDHVNVALDRAILATMPTLVTKKYRTSSNDEIVFGPGRNIELDDVNDIKALEIKDTSAGSLGIFGLLQGAGEKVAGLSEETQGMPGQASATATANVNANIRTNTRMGLRGVMAEFSFLTELFWMIGQITAQFGLAATTQKMLGDKYINFDPDGDFYMKPVSSSLEPEHSKANKINNLNTLAGLIINTGHPDAPKVMNTIINSIAELMGDNIRTILGNFDEGQEFQATGINPEQQGVTGATNQSGVPETSAEASTRG